jgi:eukaryotic-like serine/threonine-protein kinase
MAHRPVVDALSCMGASTPGQQIGRYVVVRRIGVGGMAEVYLCRQRGIGGFEKQVVVKQIRADLVNDFDFVTMFLDEARLAAHLNHPNVVQIFEADQHDDGPYIAMEYVSGPTLSALLRRTRDRKMEYGHLAHLFSGAAAGLHHAHTARDGSGRPLHIVHRDVSPQNIIISRDGTPKIFDFGVAKASGSLTATVGATVKGKLAYMAPEQLRACPVDGYADVYALGVCMYEATTGRRPFVAGSEQELLAQRLDGRFRRPSEIVDGFPTQLEHLILAAMAPHPEGRPTAEELHGALAALATGPHASSAVAVSAWVRELFPPETVDLAAEAYTASRATPSQPSDFVAVSRQQVRSGPIPSALAVTSAGAPAAAPARRRRGLVGALAAVVVIGGAAAVAIETTRDSSPALATSMPAVPMPVPAVAAIAAPRTPEAPEMDSSASAPGAVAARAPGAVAPEPPTDQVTIRADAGASIVVDRVPVGRGVVSRTRSPGRHLAEVRGPNRTARRVDVKTGRPLIADLPPPKDGHSSTGPATLTAAELPRPVEPVAPPVTTPRTPDPSAPRPDAPVVDGRGSGSASAHDRGSLDAVPSIGDVAVDGPLPDSEIESSLGRLTGMLRECYRGAAQRANRTPALAVTLTFEIDEARAIRGVRVTGDGLGIAACLRDVAGRIRTRVAPDVGTAAVSVSLKFQPTR